MIIPSIDIRKGKVVGLRNLSKGSLIRQFSCFPEINLIDLDAALSFGENKTLVMNLCKKLRCSVGGGIRSKKVAMEFLRAGAEHVIIGSSAKPEFLEQLPKHRVIVSLDLKHGRVVSRGRTVICRATLADKIRELEGFCSGFLVTNVDYEGKCAGTDMKFFKGLEGLTKKRIIVAGGISSYGEIDELDLHGFDIVVGAAFYSGKINLTEAFVCTIDFSKGLVPTIAQSTSGRVLMLGYSNRESIVKTLTTRKGVYFSRSRKRIWVKGETSGNRQRVLAVAKDCDSDALIYTVEQRGNACHTGNFSCFGASKFSQQYLLEFLKNRLMSGSKDSYSFKIANEKGALARKIVEEAREITLARSRAERVWEIADLQYFISLYMAKHNLTHEEILNELSLRHRG